MPSDADVTEPWRKAGFVCKPTDATTTDSLRFSKEFLEGCEELDADKRFSVAQVLDGTHEGGRNGAAIPAANNAANNKKRDERTKRRRKTATVFLKHIIGSEEYKEHMRARFAQDGEAMWDDYLTSMVKPPTELTNSQRKAEISSSNMLSTVGHVTGAITKYYQWIDAKNAQIQPAGARLTQHDLACKMLDALSLTGATYISGKALDEYNATAGNRVYVQPAATRPFVGARSTQAIIDALEPTWDAQIASGAISTRAAGGRQSTAGNSTRVDGHAVELEHSAFNLATGADPADAQEMSLLRSVWNSLPSTGEMRDAFVNAINAAPDRITHERICFNCFGLGHEKKDCSSKPMTRDIKAFLVLITAIVSKGGSRPIPTPPVGGPRVSSGSEAMPSGRRRPPPRWWRSHAHQKSYIERVHAKYLGQEAKPRAAPVEPGADGVKRFLSQKKAESSAEKAAASGKDFLGLCGCLSYITNQTRADCAYHVAFLQQFMSSPSIENYNSALVVLAYLYKTRDLKLTYEATPKAPDLPKGMCEPAIDMKQFAADSGLYVWSDGSWGGVTSEGVSSHCGWAVMRSGAAVCWASRKLKAAAQSSTEAETCAGVGACKDTIFVRNLLAFMEVPPTGPTPLLIDNQGMWFNVRNSGVSARTRHWEMWQQFVRKAYMDLKITVHEISGDDEAADILTKPMPKEPGMYRVYRDILLNNNKVFN